VAAVLAVLAGGFLGGLARFGLSGLVASRVGELFPWGTLAVNVLGAFLIGVFAGLAADLGPLARDFLIVGFCGGFTTVSSFALQTLALGLDGETRAALLNIAASTALSLLAVAAGYWLAA
jgi:CrcB protein